MKKKVNEQHHFCSTTCVTRSQISGLLHLKKEQTFLQNYGVIHPLKDQKIRQKIVDKSPQSQLKKKETTLRNYGVEHTFQSEIVKGKRRTTCQARFGVSEPLQCPAIWKKGHETRKLFGGYKKSSHEDAMFDELVEIFDDVHRHVVVNSNWPIDFYIPEIDTFVQYDGAYWHGLDRPLDEIKQGKTSRDIGIHQKWIFDRYQEEWFTQKGLKLIRITEFVFKDGTWRNLFG